MSCFSFSLFFSAKSENRRAERGGLAPVGGVRVRKGSRRVNTCKKCAHLHVNAKMIPVETVP
jgi:hypothetical protein